MISCIDETVSISSDPSLPRRLRDVPCTMCELVDRPDRRVVDLSPFGFPEIPVVGETYAPRTTHGSIFHRHAGCIEITLCVKGSAKFDCIDRVCSLLPGQVFVSQPGEVHRLRMNQKGIFLFWLFFRVPTGRGRIPSSGFRLTRRRTSCRACVRFRGKASPSVTRRRRPLRRFSAPMTCRNGRRGRSRWSSGSPLFGSWRPSCPPDVARAPPTRRRTRPLSA